MKVFEKSELRIFGPKGDEVRRGLRGLHNKDLHNLFSSQSMITVVISRTVQWVGHVARIE
jgi:hypothetical protein